MTLPSSRSVRTSGAVLLFVLASGALLLNGKTFSTGDSVPYRYLPLAVLRHGTLHLEAFPHLADAKHYAVVRDAQGRLISKKPVLPGLLEIPVFVAYRLLRGEWPDAERTLIHLGKITMTFVLALAAVVLFLCACRLYPPWFAFLIACGAVFLTPLWATAMDCWPHPFLALCYAGALFCTLRLERAGPAFGAGLLLGLAFAARPGALPVVVAFLAGAALLPGVSGRRRLAAVGSTAAGLAGPLLLLAWYNWHFMGSPFTTAFRDQAADRMNWPLAGLAGLLFSPAKGLFLFSPISIFMVCAVLQFRRLRHVERIALLAFALHTLFWACYADWWGGWFWGPRYMTEAAPFVALLAGFGVWRFAVLRPRLHRTAIVTILVVFTCTVQAIGLLSWNGAYHMAFSKGWSEGSHWVWRAPWEPWWRLSRVDCFGASSAVASQDAPVVSLPFDASLGDASLNDALGGSWSGPEDWGAETVRWMTGLRAAATLRFEEDCPSTVSLSAYPFSAPGFPEQRLSLFWNGRLITDGYTATPAGRFTTVTARIPGPSNPEERTGVLTIHALRSVEEAGFESEDARDLSLAVGRLRLE